MTDHDAMLAAVIAEPGDDTVRLAYADWIEEHGGQSERAEFIRLRIRIARLQADCRCGSCVRLRGGGQHHNGPCAVDKERDELPDGRSQQAHLRRRERELLQSAGNPWMEDGKQWLPESWPFDAAKDGTQMRWDWARGFVFSISLPWTLWRAHAAAIRAAQPVERVRLTTWPDLAIEGIDAEDWAMMNRAVAGGLIMSACEKEWPGIEFELSVDGVYAPGRVRMERPEVREAAGLGVYDVTHRFTVDPDPAR
jgi:uncharacterized protein (TIGR02996 family)